MVDELEHKYEVKVQTREGRQKLPDDVKEILKDGGILQKSKAVSYILKKIKRLLLIRLLLIVFPSFISNFIYDLIAKSRYLLFGKYSSCPVLVGDLKSRIIE